MYPSQGEANIDKPTLKALLATTQGGKQKARVFTLTKEEAEDTDAVAIGLFFWTLPLFSRYV
ncbi:unnamed protein product, partial [Citrullus colocynthis]